MSQSAKIAGLSFSGADCKAYATVPYRFFKNAYNTGNNSATQVPSLVRLKDLQTASISVYRDVSPVRALGHRNVRSHVRGQRTIAGSLIFAIIDEHPLQALLDTWIYEYSYDVGYWDGHNFPDQVPPFNLHLIYNAELPSKYDQRTSVRKQVADAAHGSITVLGLSLTNDGTVTSIEDLLTENTYQYVARDLHIFSGALDSRSPKNNFSSKGSGGGDILADDMRLSTMLGSLKELDPTLETSEAAALAHSLESSQATQNFSIVDNAFASQREIRTSLKRNSGTTEISYQDGTKIIYPNN